MDKPVSAKLPPIVLGRYEPDVLYEAEETPECTMPGSVHSAAITELSGQIAERTIHICELATCAVTNRTLNWAEVCEALHGMFGIETAEEAEEFVTHFFKQSHV